MEAGNSRASLPNAALGEGKCHLKSGCTCVYLAMEKKKNQVLGGKALSEVTFCSAEGFYGLIPLTRVF